MTELDLIIDVNAMIILLMVLSLRILWKIIFDSLKKQKLRGKFNVAIHEELN